MKSCCFLALLLLNGAAVSAQALQQNNGRQKQKGVPQRMPVKRLKTDSPANKMPVVKPDTNMQDKMPVVKPSPNIQPK